MYTVPYVPTVTREKSRLFFVEVQIPSLWKVLKIGYLLKEEKKEHSIFYS